MEEFWDSGGAILQQRRKESPQQKPQHLLENSYGSFTVEKTKKGLAIEVARKNSYQQQENTFPHARKALNQDRALARPQGEGVAYVDNLHGALGAVRYEETSAVYSPEEIYKHLCQVKENLPNQTLEEMMPQDKEEVENKLCYQIAQALEEKDTESVAMATFAPQGERDPPPEESEDTEENPNNIT